MMPWEYNTLGVHAILFWQQIGIRAKTIEVPILGSLF